TAAGDDAQRLVLLRIPHENAAIPRSPHEARTRARGRNTRDPPTMPPEGLADHPRRESPQAPRTAFGAPRDRRAVRAHRHGRRLEVAYVQQADSHSGLEIPHARRAV